MYRGLSVSTKYNNFSSSIGRAEIRSKVTLFWAQFGQVHAVGGGDGETDIVCQDLEVFQSSHHLLVSSS